MKKAQVRIGETIAVLFIFMVLIILGFTFYVRVQRVTIEADIEKTVDARTIELTQRASFIPELQCSSKNIVTNNCLDIMKLEGFQGIVANNQNFFFDEFLYSTISVRKIYPKKDPIEEWTIYDNSIAETSELFDKKTSTLVPILLYNATSKKYNAGILEVVHYSVKLA